MRRLIVIVAVAAAALLAPSAALAAVVLSGPVIAHSPALTWTDTAPLPMVTTYQVERAPMACASATALDFVPIGGNTTDTRPRATTSSAK